MRILFEGKKATGVQTHSKGKDSVIQVSKEVIVSAGAIETPKLLVLSGLENAQVLNIPVIKNLPAVGKNLQHQIYLTLIFVPDDASSDSYVGYDIKYSGVKKYFKSKSDVLAKNPTLYLGFLNIALFSKNANDTRMEMSAIINSFVPSPIPDIPFQCCYLEF